MTFEEALAADTLGLLLPEALPRIATDALVAGAESTSLAALAGESPRASSADDLHALFNKALEELRITRPSPIDAVSQLIRYYARRVVSRELPPERGVDAVARTLRELRSVPDPAATLGIGELAWLHLDFEALHEGFGSAEDLNERALEAFRQLLDAPAV